MSHPLPATSPAWTLTAVSYASPDARRLTQALHQEQLATYGFADDPVGTPAGEFEGPHGTFLIASPGCGPALACGGWRTAGPGTAEIKRMYVAPVARGHGLGRCVLEALESDAIQHGMTQMILETGARNHVALSLYAACGYTRVPPYVAGRDPDVNRAMQKTLGPPAVRTAGQQIHAISATSPEAGCDTQLYMADDGRHDLGVCANHQLQMANPPTLLGGLVQSR
jgi:GNAT superfamily N-acetyltransferase